MGMAVTLFSQQGGAHASDVQLSDVEASVGGDLLLRGGSGVTGGGVEIRAVTQPTTTAVT